MRRDQSRKDHKISILAARLPEALLSEARRIAPRALKGDVSRLLERALRLWVWERKEHLVDLDIRRMGRDPHVVADCRKINEEFSVCDNDGLEGL